MRSRSPARRVLSTTGDTFALNDSDELASVVHANSELNLSARTGPSRRHLMGALGNSTMMESVATIDENVDYSSAGARAQRQIATDLGNSLDLS